MKEPMCKHRSVLLIGKHSYIGKSFVNYCESNLENESACLDKETISMPASISVHAVSGKNGEWKRQDFSVYDSVILLSGIVHHKVEKELYYEVNQRLAVEIAKKAKEEHVKQFIYMSTIAVYGDQLEDIDQSTKPAPTTDYAKSKLYAENDLKELEDESFQVAIVRPPMVFGRECPGNFTRLVRLIEKLHIFVTYQNQRSAIYIDNLCEFLCCLIRNQVGGIFVPQNPEYLCSTEVAVALEEEGRKVFMIKGVGGLIRFLSKHNRQLNKLFGNYRYAVKDSEFQNMNYHIYQMKESLQLSIQNNQEKSK